MDRARHDGPRGRGGQEGDRDRGASLFGATRAAFGFRKPANDNRLGFRGWAERVGALALLIGLAALLVWKILG